MDAEVMPSGFHSFPTFLLRAGFLGNSEQEVKMARVLFVWSRCGDVFGGVSGLKH